MTCMRQVWRALPRPNPIKCECCMVFGCVLLICPALSWLLSIRHDARDADDAGSWGAAGRLRGAVNSNKTLKIHAVGNVCGSMTFLTALLAFLTPACLNQAKMGSPLC